MVLEKYIPFKCLIKVEYHDNIIIKIKPEKVPDYKEGEVEIL